MASTYTTNHNIELIGTGEQAGNWGDITNSNFEIIDSALGGKLGSTQNAVSSSRWASSITLTLTGDLSGSVSFDGQSDQDLEATVTSVADNAVTLGTHTTGNYVQSVAVGLGITISNQASTLEGSIPVLSLTAGFGDNVNPFGSKSPNSVLAGPNSGSSNAPASFRSLVAADIPTLSISKISGLQSTLDGKLGSGSNAVSASKWQTARTITLGGDLSGSVSIDGQSNVTLNATVDNNAAVTTQDFKNSGNFKSYILSNLSAYGSSATYAGWITVWKDRYVLIGFINSSDTANDANFKVFDLETETLYSINTYSGSTVYLERPYFLQNLDGSLCSTDGDSFFIASGHYFLNSSRKKIGKVTATDSNPSNWTISYYGDSPYTTHSRYPSTNDSYPTSTSNGYRGWTISPNAVVKGNNIYCVAYYQYYVNKYIGKLLKFDTSTNTLTETDILSLVEGAGWGIPYALYNLDFYGNDRDPDRYIGITLADNTKIRGAAVYDITDNHFETSVQYNTLRGTSAWSSQGVGGPILPNGEVIICPSSSATSSTDATVGIYNLNPNSAGFLEVDLKQGFGNDHDWTTTAFSYPTYFCDSKTFGVGIYDYTSNNSAPHIFDTSSLSAKHLTRGNVGASTSNVAFASGDAFVTRFCPKPLSDGRRIAFQYRYDISYSSYNNARVRYSDKILTVFKPER
jgi:hypothetical protein